MLKKVILGVGCLVVAVAAGWASFSTLAFLAEATDWPGGYWLLPTSIDVLGAVGCYAWLTSSFPAEARRFARWTTFAAIGASVLGNAVGHLVSAHAVPVSVPLIVLVGAVPPSSLAAIIHLIVQCFSSPVEPAKPKSVPVPDTAPVRAPVAQPVERILPGPAKPKPAKRAVAKKTVPKPSPDKTVDEVLVHRAKKLDDEYVAKHGRPIPRDDARPLLGVSNEKTGEALRLARESGVA